MRSSTQGGYPGGPGGIPPGQRRVYRRPRDLEQLLDVLSGGGAEDPEEFLSLLSAAPRFMGRPPPQPPQPPQQAGMADAYRRQLQQQAAAAAEAEAARRRALQQQQQQQQQQQLLRQQEEERLRQERIRAAMLQNAQRHLPSYDAQSVARLASGLADAGVTDPAICDAIIRRMVAARQQQQQQQQAAAEAAAAQAQAQQAGRRGPPRQSGTEYRSLADLLDAMAAMRHRPSDAQLAELLRLQQQQQQQAPPPLPPPPPPPPPQPPVPPAAASSPWPQMRLQPRGMGTGSAPAQPSAAAIRGYPQQQSQSQTQSQQAAEAAVAAAGASERRSGSPGGGMSADDAARTLYALSRLGYQPDEATLSQLLNRLQPQARAQPASAPAAAQAAPEADAEVAEEAEEAEEEVQVEDEEEEDEEFDEFEQSLQREAQAVASAVRALERMGRPQQAAQLRQRFLRSMEEARARTAAQREELRRRREEAAAARRQRQAQAIAAAARQEREQLQREADERERRQREAAAAAVAAEREAQRRKQEQSQREEAERRERELRSQLARRLRSANEWQTIRALLFTYQEALDPACLLAAAARLTELLGPSGAAARRPTGPLGLRERSELGDLMEGLGQLVLRSLPAASGQQAAGLLVAVLRLRHLEEGLVVGLLRRLREELGGAGAGELAGVLEALAECGLRPSAPWMEAFLGRCEEQLEAFSPEQLASLPVYLARLGAHPGRSWLGSYLDVLQERERELGQAAVSAAVRAVASLDRSFLAAWRQAAAVRMQMEAQAAARAAAAAAQQQQQQGGVEQASGALASVDEALSGAGEWQQDGDEEGIPLPPMHPKQAGMAAQAAGPAAPAAGRAAQSEGAGAISPPMQSIELDVDSEDVAYGSGASISASAAGSGAAAAAAAEAAPSGETPAYEGRQLPGSYSVDGYYTPGMYDQGYDSAAGEEEAEGLEEVFDGQGLVLDEAVAEVVAEAAHAPAAGGAAAALDPQQASTVVEAEVVDEDASASAGSRAAPQAGPSQPPPPPSGNQEAGLSAPEAKPKAKPPPSPEDLARARSLRSLLLERYEAVSAYKEELEERQRRAEAGEEEGEGVAVSAATVAAAVRFKAARDQLERLQADFENFKRRAALEREQATARAKADVLKPLLGIADNFERAAASIKPKTDGERAVHEAYQAVYAELKEFIRQQGLEEVGAEGEAFDPNRHEAVMRDERDDVEEGTITAVFQKGYALGELLVRPALVRVAYSP
ncbi:hypothetical protein GPECTOR_39g402 [Gonium pectorale]|uniref:GrpE protein homolog n=1 Tax=Gonium pectorale TaxID=33097 RepID=A0A150GAQ9_GONPE|nr:hypothetical protein GPECTOR_39g402 [Gonium pectorale]|eukprot:KXZ46908.1 hypothetical protein GPECTOR_39g402 [Gonium pectorale]